MDFQEMIRRWARPGLVGWIGLRPERRQAMQPVPRAEIAGDGLVGDHGRAGKRAVTLIQAEHLVPIGSYLGQAAPAPGTLRRNIVVEGLNLMALRGRRIAVGGAVLEITGPCAPCSRMEAALGPGGYAAMRGHGGWCAGVVSPGSVAIGDPVRPVD
jgi:MOSC domain-containing protein YiiM